VVRRAKLITGATGATYKLEKQYAGKRIKVMVSVTLAGYEVALRVSPPTKKVRR
jgi:hypothetical protein